MELTIVIAACLASMTSARSFTLYDENNFGGAGHAENRGDDAACYMRVRIRRCIAWP
ncbi:hypothetical protein BU23DRAFT_75284 [Bimuria novae-zelandiae CBS 107.79]|uniref:Uncharacterized protein n=1 Tax=Bimuria novae-zelandiae CBS 107.79 TaxID=1447943 RepID=A0A6A5VEC8_9PLEO|nr:hypothetical protein BU23DRAFT_75284 [Bimuria novae-zelandiae CBS 107.79]